MEEPSSATAITGGSVCLSVRWGAMARMRMPLAQRPMMVRPCWKSCGEMGCCLGVGDIAAGYAIGRVDFAVQFGLELLGERQRRDAENEDGRLHHASLPV